MNTHRIRPSDTDVGATTVETPPFIQTAARTDQITEGPTVPDVVVQSPPRYMVGVGETLATIAHTVYGNPNAWSKLYNANLMRIDNPMELHPGTILNVPS